MRGDQFAFAFGDDVVEERFWLRVQVDQFGCWIWTGARNGDGYGIYRERANRGEPGALVTAHRHTWVAFVGPIPLHLEIDHLCRNRACCRPSCMETVPHVENMRRRWSGRRVVA